MGNGSIGAGEKLDQRNVDGRRFMVGEIFTQLLLGSEYNGDNFIVFASNKLGDYFCYIFIALYDWDVWLFYKCDRVDCGGHREIKEECKVGEFKGELVYKI
jgi:hypothetical protein